MSLSSAASAFQCALYSILSQDAELQDMANGIYDFVPQRSAFPYISLAVLQVRDASSRACHISEVTANITIWSSYHGKHEALEIAEHIDALVQDDNLVLDTGQLIALRQLSQTHDVLRDGKTRRGQLRYRAHIKEQEIV